MGTVQPKRLRLRQAALKLALLFALLMAMNAGASCIRRAPTLAPREPLGSEDDERRARSSLEAARARLTEERFQDAVRLASSALSREPPPRLSMRTRAELLDVIAEGAFGADLPDTPARCDAALLAWENVPGSDDEVAGAVRRRGAVALLFERDLVRAEQLHRRAIAIHEHRYGPEGAPLVAEIRFLFDIYAGAEFFTSTVPAIEPCQPDSSSELGGWIFRGERASEQLADCADIATPPMSADSVMYALMRVENGLVVAARVVGIGVEPTTLNCAARKVIGLSVPGPHDFNFVDALYRREHQ